MPWWRKKSSRSKDLESGPIENEKKIGKEHKGNKAKSFDEVSGIVLLQKQSKKSPRNSREYASTIGRGFSGFDSASSLDIGHPLPRPLESSTDHVHGVGSGSGSASVSSTGSSGSTDDQPHLVLRRNGDSKWSPVMMLSPGRGSSPRFGGIDKVEDGKSECHRLPLPPGSPTNPSALPMPRSPGRPESSCGIIISSKWRKGRLLGRGTFGHVYLGFNCENGQMCAIKEVRVVSDDQSSRECLKQLNQEITLLSQLSHANIVRYYGSDLSEETLSVYLEYVSGGSIHKLLQEYGAFGEPVIQNYTRQILSGLAYLHGRNTVHRDIKGANILVDPNGEIKLADFGMAKHITSCSSMLSFKGSPYWMAPEVVMNMNGYSLAVDIWSLGCTILEMATSKPPWSQFEGVAAIFKIGNSKDMPEIPDHLSSDAKNFIRLCLQREPSARPTASQLLAHPFVRNQTTIRANITREAFPCAFDGSRTPTALEMQSSRLNNFSFDRDDATRSPVVVPRTLLSPRENARTITSLPVSPSSSPLRAAHKSSLISPPHPSYPLVGQSGGNYFDHLVFPVRPTTRITLDPWLEIPQFKSQIPVRSPTRTII